MALKRDFLLTPEDIQFSENLKVMADVLDYSQKDLSEFFNVNRVTINNYFNQRNHPTVQFLILLELSTGIPMINWVCRKIERSEMPPRLQPVKDVQACVQEKRAGYGLQNQIQEIKQRLSRVEAHLSLPKIGNK